MRKWFWLYMTFSIGMAASLLLALQYLLVHIMGRILPDFDGWKEFLLFSTAPFLFSQLSNFAGRRIKKIAAEGAEGAKAETPWWFRAFERIVSALGVILVLLTSLMLILYWKGWFVR